MISRAFWRRIEPYKNDHGKELPEDVPVEFMAHMGTALFLLERRPGMTDIGRENEALKRENERLSKIVYTMDGLEEALNDCNFGDAKEWYRHLIAAIKQLTEGGEE